MSLFGWSYPPGCKDSMLDVSETPLISGVCPNCLAVNINWVQNIEQENPLLYKCPHCNHVFDPDPDYHGFKQIYSDDFADLITDHFPKNDQYDWVVLGTGVDSYNPLKVEIGFKISTEGSQSIEHSTIIELETDDKGQIQYHEVENICKQLIKKFSNL